MKKAKKKILIINSHFEIGGIETSMVNMANALCEYYEIDLFVYNSEGPIKERLDPRVNIIKPCFAIKAMGMSFKQALKSGNIFVFLFKLLGSIWSRIFDNRLPIWFATKFQKNLTGYDLAIAYRFETYKKVMESGFARVLDRNVQASVKAVWLHYDATHYGKQYTFNVKYYKKIDKIIGVSESVAKSFQSVNPELSDKVDYCYNFINYGDIEKKSKGNQVVDFNKDDFICFSAMRLAKEKAVTRAIAALSPAFEEHKDIKWYIAGDGPERSAIEAAIESYGLIDRVVLLGNQNNPYPYIKKSDLFMLLSYHEAAPVVYNEAHALGVPVFTTRTSSSDEMLDDGVDAFICENSEEGIRKAFADLMANREKIAKAKSNLENQCKNNDESLKKIQDLINNKNKNRVS